MDTWRKVALGHRRYVHVVGYNADEAGRISGDASVTMGGRREPIYPVHQWNWTRQQCLDYLLRVFGVRWPNSCCRQCCFAGGRTGWPAQLARYQAYPAEAAHHVVDEFVTVALNKDSGLFGPGDALADRLERGQAREVLRLARRRAHSVRWALYRVRWLFWAPAQAWRSVLQVRLGDPTTVQAALRMLTDGLGLPLRTDAGHPRLWLAERPKGVYPAIASFGCFDDGSWI